MRRIAGCVPMRRQIVQTVDGGVAATNAEAVESISLLIISSRKRPNTWVFPKGGIKREESASEAAIRETFEEAGIEGPLLAQLEPQFQVSGWTKPPMQIPPPLNQEWIDLGVGPAETWFLMHAQQLHQDWPEREERERRWV